MKTLTVFALVCALMVLTRAAVLPVVVARGGLSEDHRVVKRSTNCGTWTEFNGRCYHFVPKGMTWAQAERNCQSMSANLVSIHSMEEYHEIQRLIMNRMYELKETWTGGSDAQQEGYWFWSDGTNFRFTNWCPGEPNNAGYQHCLLINHTGDRCWDDRQCEQKFPSICSKKP